MQYFEPFLNFVDSLQTENVESRVVEQKYDTLYEIDLFVPISGHEKLKTEIKQNKILSFEEFFHLRSRCQDAKPSRKFG